jgi:TetR/AcrR family transcriptional repressor of mexCD-oprJ operon
VSEPSPREGLQQRVAAAILDAAAGVLAARGEHASMLDVAAAAGVARATVYRYFPSRQALLDELARLALSDAATRLAGSRITEVPPEEGIRRAVRSLVEVGDYLIVVARERVRPRPDDFESSIASPLRRLMERAVASGVVRSDVPVAWLVETLVGSVVSVLSSAVVLGREDTIAAVTSVYLDGARAGSRSVAVSRSKEDGDG